MEPEVIADVLEDELDNILPIYDVIKVNPEISDKDVYQIIFAAK